MILLAPRSIQLNTLPPSIYLILVSLQVIRLSLQQHLLPFLSPLNPLMQRKSTSVRRATVASLPVATLPGTFAFTQVNAITNVLFLDAKHVVLGKTTYSNSESIFYSLSPAAMSILVILSVPHSNSSIFLPRMTYRHHLFNIFYRRNSCPTTELRFLLSSTVTAFISRLAHDGAQAPQRVLQLPVPWAPAVLAQKIAEPHRH